MRDGTKVAVKRARYHVEDDIEGHNMRVSLLSQIGACNSELQASDRFQLIAREIHAWSKCHHDNVLELIGLTQHRGKLAVVAPWIENGNLRQYLGKNPDVDRLDLCLQITRGLAYLHSHDMVHGDLKGANVLISDAGVPKLADFGNTKLKEQTLQLTTQTTTPFSLRWAAPEILNNSPCSVAADVYALGMTIYEIVTGDVPYADKTDTAVLVEVLYHQRLPSWNSGTVWVENGKDQLWQLMCDCWNREASLRPITSQIEMRLDMIVKRPNERNEEIVGRVELNNVNRHDDTQSFGFQASVELDPTRFSIKSQPPTSSVSRFASILAENKIHRKLVIVGDGGCGKSCLLTVYSKGTFPEGFMPTVFEDYVVADVEIDGKYVGLALWDTAGLTDYDRLRPLSYPDAHVVLICFAIDLPNSLDNVAEKWISEVKYFCPGVPYILVGCQKDLRRDHRTIEELRRTGQHPVTPEEGIQMAKKIGALRYLECSAKTNEGVRDVFEHATRAALRNSSQTEQA
ncbi:GTP-binding protein Rho1 [Ceratobasidium sp. 428]|nr:GTP-binding protein Rho1 [Ceratobasidium sp. 428]